MQCHQLQHNHCSPAREALLDQKRFELTDFGGLAILPQHDRYPHLSAWGIYPASALAACSGSTSWRSLPHTAAQTWNAGHCVHQSCSDLELRDLLSGSEDFWQSQIPGLANTLPGGVKRRAQLSGIPVMPFGLHERMARHRLPGLFRQCLDRKNCAVLQSRQGVMMC